MKLRKVANYLKKARFKGSNSLNGKRVLGENMTRKGEDITSKLNFIFALGFSTIVLSSV